MKRKIEYWESQSIALFGRNINLVLLIHANSLNSEYFPELCKMIRSFDYKFISLDEALKDEAYKSKDTFTGGGGISWIHRWAMNTGKSKEFFAGEPLTPKIELYVNLYVELRNATHYLHYTEKSFSMNFFSKLNCYMKNHKRG
jgi:hypothetical protein